MSSNARAEAPSTTAAPRIRLSDSYLVRLLWRFLRPYRFQLVGVLFLLLAVSGLDVALPWLIQQAVDGPIAEGNLDGIWPYGLAYIGIVVLLFILRFAQTIWLQTIGQNALVRLRQTLFEHIMRQDLTYFNTTPVGKIVSRMSNDIEALTELLSTSIVMVASNLITLVGIILVMFALNWRLALISCIVLPIMAFVSFFYRKRIRRVSSEFHRIMAEYQAYLNEQFNGMLVVQLFGRQQNSRDDFEQVSRGYFNIHMELRDIYTHFANWLQVLTTFGLAVVLWGGGAGVLAGWASLGMLIAFIEYTRRSFDPLLQLAEQFAQIQTALSAGERIARMLNTEPDIVEPEKPTPLEHFDQSVTLEGVKFAYKANHPVIHNMDLVIPPEQRVAIVGATGAGKSTLVKLLARYYDVQEGSIRLGGVDIRDLRFEDLRRCLTVVPQSPYCFNGTIADNLRLFDPRVSDEQMIAAARTACAAPFIDKLPGGYNFELLPGGMNLSQGQRQLLALARALIHSPESILVLDEATSNIDTETEVLIQEGMEHVLKGRTSIIIAHRLSTVRDSDRILVMDQGRVVEDGSHEELLAQNGVYARLYRRQFREDEPVAGD